MSVCLLYVIGLYCFSSFLLAIVCYRAIIYIYIYIYTAFPRFHTDFLCSYDQYSTILFCILTLSLDVYIVDDQLL